MISALKPGLFPIALSGLQEGTYREPSPAIPGRPVGAARTGTRGRGCILAPSCVPRWRGWPPKAAGGGFEPRNFGQGMQICSTPFGVGPLGLSGIPCSPSTWLPIRSERGHVVAPRANRVPQGRKRIAPGFNPGIHVAPRSSPVGTTESASGPRSCPAFQELRSRSPLWPISSCRRSPGSAPETCPGDWTHWRKYKPAGVLVVVSRNGITGQNKESVRKSGGGS